MLRGLARIEHAPRLAAAILLVVGVSACSNPVPGDPKGPYAAASPGPAQAVINHGCDKLSQPSPGATDVGFMKSSMLRQQADLDRVATDLSGTVPGGNLPADAALAKANATVIVDLVDRSTLCSPFKGKVLAAAKSLAAADEALGSAPGADTLQSSQAAFDALNALVGPSPTPSSSASP